MASLIDSYPPPYRLHCDAAVFPVLVDAGPAQRWAGAALPSFFGKSLLLLMAVKYHYAEYGPGRAALPAPQPDALLYTEIACALPTSLSLRPRALLPHLWVESLSPLPIGIGLEYGFPKAPAAVHIDKTDAELLIEATDDRGAILRINAKTFLWFPPFLLRGALRALLPRAGLAADLALKSVRRSYLLAISDWRLDRLERWGMDGAAPFGLWLEDAVIELGPPLGSDQPFAASQQASPTPPNTSNSH